MNSIDFIESTGLEVGQFAAIYVILMPILLMFLGFVMGRLFGKRKDDPARFAGFGCFGFFVLTFIMALIKIIHLIVSNEYYKEF